MCSKALDRRLYSYALGLALRPRNRLTAMCNAVVLWQPSGAVRFRPFPRLTTTLAACSLALATASCVQAGSHRGSLPDASGSTTASAATSATASRSDTSSTPTTAPAATTTTSATTTSATTATTAKPSTPPSTVADQLTAWGATEANWDLNHQADPRIHNHTGFWPRLSNGLDTYASVSFAGGKALRYTENLYPSETASQARYVVHDELPPSAHLISLQHQPGCEELIFSSPKLLAMAGSGVRATLLSPGPVFDAADVVSITYQPSAVSPPVPTAPC